MKRILALTLALTLLLAGCGQGHTPPETTAAPTQTVPAATEPPATTEPTTVPTTEPPVYYNPLNGQILDEPYTGRIFATTISNIPAAIPHVGVNQADILMEMFVNSSIIRCLALYTDISQVESVGSTRSTRLMFNDIAQHYDAILTHASGSEQVLEDAAARGIDHFSLDRWSKDNDYSFRDPDRKRQLGNEHSLMGIGSGIVKRAQELGYSVTQPEDKDYCLTFTEDGTPDGEAAGEISITFNYKGTRKETIMRYDRGLGKYVFNQYGKEMTDGVTGEKEAFRNVVVMYTNISTSGIYHVADFVAGGTGYFACGGQIVPITWTCDSEDSPFRFLTQDGRQLELGMGNTYIAICPVDSPVTWTEPEVPETTAETSAETTSETAAETTSETVAG